MAECETCRSGAADLGENGYTGWHTDGTERWFCRDCGRLVSDPIVWVGGERHGHAVRADDEVVNHG